DKAGERFHVVPNGVDAAYWEAGEAGDVRARHGLPEDAPLALFVGGFWPHKEVDTLIEATALTQEIHLVLAGPDRGRAEEIRALARSLGVEARVHMVGAVDRDELRALYHACDVHASASNNEGFGLTFLEAMACGKPVVARPVGVIPDLVDQDGVVEVAKDPQGFAASMTRLAATPAPGNVALARTYDWERILDQVEALYERVAQEGSP
ncbi:MAG: glycosyltransferase family 4 protein, partial [Candidatus Thermoplasmatota archaeon]|nr:glycosyltransferase family 4 protein [Candidatus Thermoplasmatota archaeon]